MKNIEYVTGQLVDLANREIYPAKVTVHGGKIANITRLPEAPDRYLMPGFIDSHVHIESSMLVPASFARLAVVHGTVATVSDPHEIANVLGVEGVDYMIDNGKKVPFKFYFGAPSCVPATAFETAGATIDPAAIGELLARPEIKYLAEMMNWPGVLYGDQEVMDKIRLAHQLGKPVDGHAPGLKGGNAATYARAGISTDHECYSQEEALDKLALGMKVIIREGSAARNFSALSGLITQHYQQMMFCSDDKHPDELVQWHINGLVSRAVKEGHDLFKVLEMACANPVRHYGLEVGLLRPGNPADFIVVQDLTKFHVLQTVIDGQVVAEEGRSLIGTFESAMPNRFEAGNIRPEMLQVPAQGGRANIIVAHDGELVTSKEQANLPISGGFLQPDAGQDVLKIIVADRYSGQKPAAAFIKGFGLKNGAIASTVAHDSHNLIAVGTSDEWICEAANKLIAAKGGIAAVGEVGGQVLGEVLPLPVAGLMSNDDAFAVAARYSQLDAWAKKLGSQLRAPFMALSFMALLVIPSIKISDKGLFDADKFEFIGINV